MSNSLNVNLMLISVFGVDAEGVILLPIYGQGLASFEPMNKFPVECIVRPRVVA